MRHGRSRADDEGVHEGRYDSPLTETGRAQALARAQDWLAQNTSFGCIISSTLRRATETAEIIGKILGIPIEGDPDWMEINNGPLAGLLFDIAAVKYPKPDFRNPYEPLWLTGESDWEVYCRAARAVEKVVRRGSGHYLVVAHGMIFNTALRTIVGAQPPVNGTGIWFSFGDTGYARFDYYPNEHQWVLRELRPG